MNMDYDRTTEICYLCANQLGDSVVNFDHVFQQQFLGRDQPIAKGFDYAGVLPVHVECNSKFGTGTDAPEAICKKALQLLEIFHSPGTLYERRDNPSIRIAAINSALFPDFTKQDLSFFKIIDAINMPYEHLTSGDFLSDKEMIVPSKIPTNVALTTLAKSAAGFLVKRYGYPRQGRWRILAIPYIGQNQDFDLDHVFGGMKPLEMGIKLWIKPESHGWFLAYKHSRLLVFFAFKSDASDLFRLATNAFRNAGCLFYDSHNLIDLVGHEWSESEYPLVSRLRITTKKQARY